MQNKVYTPFWKRKNTPWIEQSSYSGCDIIPIVYGVDPSTKKPALFALGNIQTLTYSIHRDKGAVRTLGRANPKGFTRGCVNGLEKIYTQRGYIPISEVLVGDQILSMDETSHKISYQLCTNKFDKGKQSCYKVKLEDSSEMSLTQTHLVFTNNGWKTVSELDINDSLYVPLDYGTDIELNIPDYYIKFMSYAIGDGVFGLYKEGKETRFSFTPGINDINIISDIERECVNNNILYSKNFRNNCYNIIIKNCKKPTDWKQREYNPFILWTRLLGIYGKYSHEKTIPDMMMNMSKRQTTLLLNRLFGTDGYINVRKPKTNESVRISYTTTSKQLSRQIKTLLAKVGIFSYIMYTPVEKLASNKKRPEIIHRHGIYKIIIPSDYHYKFLQNIGIFGKDEKYKPLLNSLLNNVKYEYQDLRLYLSENKLPIRKRFGAGISNNNASSITYEFLKNKLGKYFDDFISKYKPLFDKGYKLVKLTSIEFDQETDTYDIEVENNHNLFGSFLSHNSRTIAGSIIFSVFDRRALWELSKNKLDLKKRVSIADELPGFDIILYFTNEYGSESTLIVKNVQIVDEGQSHSVEDMYIENSMGYIAGDIDLLEPQSAHLPSAAEFLSATRMEYNKVHGPKGIPYNYSYVQT